MCWEGSNFPTLEFLGPFGGKLIVSAVILKIEQKMTKQVSVYISQPRCVCVVY